MWIVALSAQFLVDAGPLHWALMLLIVATVRVSYVQNHGDHRKPFPNLVRLNWLCGVLPLVFASLGWMLCQYRVSEIEDTSPPPDPQTMEAWLYVSVVYWILAAPATVANVVSTVIAYRQFKQKA